MTLKERRTARVTQRRSPKPREEAVAPPATVEQQPAAEPAIQEKAATGKLAKLTELLRAEGGATIAQMMASTGWQAHSVRGAIAGSIKKKLGYNVVSEKTDGERTYRIVAA